MVISPKKLNGLAIANFGCGPRSYPGMNNLDSSIFVRLSKRPRLIRLLKTIGFVNFEREQFIQKFSPDILIHDLSAGIPFPDNSLDVIYHSHFLEHLTCNDATNFTGKCMNKLKPGGTLRIVVPDLFKLCTRYLESYAQAKSSPSSAAAQRHDLAIYNLLQQHVLTDKSTQRRPLLKAIESLVLGNRKDKGDLHLWMYDDQSLFRFMTDMGFKNIVLLDHLNSRIPLWRNYGLDANADGSPYKPDSIYMEGQK